MDDLARLTRKMLTAMRLKMQPSPEYLRLLDKLLKCRDDESFNLAQNDIQEYVNRDIGSILQLVPFVERYNRGIAAIHIHGLVGVNTIGRPFNYCASIQKRKASSGPSTAESNILPLPHAGTDKIQMSVLVDVRQVDEKSKNIIGSDEGIPSMHVVRLHSLNYCKSTAGNPRKVFGEVSLSKRGRTAVRKLGSDRKLTILAPLGINGRDIRIPLDEVECEMVEGRAHLINHLPRKKRNLSRRSFREIQLVFALRLWRDSVRLTSCIFGDATLDSAQVFLSPDELKFRRFDTAKHERKEYQPESWLAKYIIADI